MSEVVETPLKFYVSLVCRLAHLRNSRKSWPRSDEIERNGNTWKELKNKNMNKKLSRCLLLSTQ